MSGRDGDLGLVVLQQVVTQLREAHRACRYGMTVCNLGGCPWPVMFDEDVTALHHALREVGFEIRPRNEGAPGGTG